MPKIPIQPLDEVLAAMKADYLRDPVVAVRSQSFIKLLHGWLAADLRSRLTHWARNSRGVYVKEEANLLAVIKEKSVDVAVIDLMNGPLLLTGVRSQMSSVAKNVPIYLEGVLGDASALQERFPLSTHGYVYLHPLRTIKPGSEGDAAENHKRYARMYANISGRSGRGYRNERGIFDHFAYLVVDFSKDPPELRDDIVQTAAPNLDMSVTTYLDRMVETFRERVFMQNEVFELTDRERAAGIQPQATEPLVDPTGAGAPGTPVAEDANTLANETDLAFGETEPLG